MSFAACLAPVPIACTLVAFASAAPQDRPLTGPSVDFSHGPLRVSDNRRFLQHADGTPFLWIGDTAWELFHRLTREETERYLERRRLQGFTVIQAVALAELDGLDTPNAYGERPLQDHDPTRPNDRYFDHVDWVVRRAAEKGLVVGLLPTWGDKVVTESWGKGPVIFNPDRPDGARAYGRFLGARYRTAPNVIWILGGDRKAAGFEPVWHAMAEGITAGSGGTHLMTYHPQGGRSSSEWFHDAEWLDFNMLQSGHGRRDLPNDEMIDGDYGRAPAKPVLDGEPRYENHPVDWDPRAGWFDDFDVRQAMYWSVFAGGFGVTYGCHDVWQMMAPGREPISSARNSWYDVLDLPGAWDVVHLRRLLLSRPFFSRVPDQGIVAGDAGTGEARIRASRGDGYAFVYIPTGRDVTVRTEWTDDAAIVAWWFDPRTGGARRIGERPGGGTHEFTPPGTPGRHNDWVLVLDAKSRGFGSPGAEVVR